MFYDVSTMSQFQTATCQRQLEVLYSILGYVKSHEDMVRIGYGLTRRLTRNLTMGERIELNNDGGTEKELPRNVTESRGQK